MTAPTGRIVQPRPRTAPQVLVVDDDADFCDGLVALIRAEGFAVTSAGSLQETRSKLKERPPDVLLLDMELPDGSGMDLLRELGGEFRGDIVIITGHASIDAAVEAIRLGAANFLTKPVDFARVKALLAGLDRTLELKSQIGSLRQELRQLGRFGAIIGASPAMQAVYDMIAKVAPTDATVLLSGETGTGKELVAQTLHELSSRKRKPFVAVNCGAISPHLIGSEFFGHERGSFTGADRQHRGHFESADGGTLFLDEITEMPMDMQVDLLRVLESRSFRRVGGQQSIEVDVRIVSATNVVPSEAVAAGKLRLDLLYRLNLFPIELPPLRNRGNDVELLAEHLLESFNKEAGTSKRFTLSALDRVRAHPWPGNVRELRNVIHRAFILAEHDIPLDALPLGAEEATSTGLNLRVGTTLAEADRRLILATLEHCSGDKKATAAMLGVSLKTVYNKLNEYKPR